MIFPSLAQTEAHPAQGDSGHAAGLPRKEANEQHLQHVCETMGNWGASDESNREI